MDYTKRKILESVGFIVGTSSEYIRMTQAEEEFLKHHLQLISALETNKDDLNPASVTNLPGILYEPPAEASPKSLPPLQ